MLHIFKPINLSGGGRILESDQSGAGWP